MIIVGLIALAVTAIWLAIIIMQVDDWSRDWSTNVAEVTPDARDKDLQSPRFTESLDAVTRRIESWTRQQSNWTLESIRGTDRTNEIHLTRKTRLFRFTDDIHVRLSQLADGSVLFTAKSQSRVGKGDLGQNPRNLKELLQGAQKISSSP